MEQGKDIITIHPDGHACSFQLKSGDLTLANWRAPDQPLKGQVEDLLDLPIQHPSLKRNSRHVSTLVTTGMLDDTLRQTIDAFNAGRESLSKAPVHVIVKGDIADRIKRALGRFFPAQLKDFRDLLQLVVVDGGGMIDRKQVAMFLEKRFADQLGETSKIALKRTCAEIVILGTYIAWPYQSAGNHISQIEVWAIVFMLLMRVASCSAAAKSVAFESIALVEFEIWERMKDLVNEIRVRDNYSEGNIWADALVYDARITHVAGFLSAAVLWEKHFGEDIGAKETFRRFKQNSGGRARFWGEGAVPAFLAEGWAWEQISAEWHLERSAFSLIKAISLGNAPGSDDSAPGTESKSGIPDPYVSLSDTLKTELRTAAYNDHRTYRGQSYTCESLVNILVRRRFRQHLNMIWSGVTQLAFATFIPNSPADLWRWNNQQDGYLETRQPLTPTSWAELLRTVESPSENLIPKNGRDVPHLLLVLLLVAPHRLNPSVALMFDSYSWGERSTILSAGRKGRHTA
jgi:hypothetical protein